MPSIPEPSEHKFEEEHRSVTQPALPVQQSGITVVPAPKIVPPPDATITTSQTDNPERKRQNILTRTLWTFIMIGGFLGMSPPCACDFHLCSSAALLLLGHGYMILLVMLCQTAVYREVTALFSIKNIDGEEALQEKDPWSKTLNWYFFAVTNYYLYGESIIYYFKVRGHRNLSSPSHL
jgi:phosphatidate cytidylyltransferase